MKRAFLREHGKAIFDLIEEAFHLLRLAPARTLAAYYLGSAPFIAGFLVFWTDMSSSPLAHRHLGAATLGMAALFLWMKFWHARFARGLLAELSGQAPPATAGRGLRSFATQAAIQATGLFVLPLAALVILPFAWAYAFYQNATVLDGEDDMKTVVRQAARQSRFWPGQNHLLLLVLTGFGLYVFLNWFTFMLLAPQLVKMLFGIETVFTRSPFSLLNTTLFAATAGLTFLSVDPLVKACYVLRCFQGLSLNTGQDLRTELRQFARVATLVIVLAAGAPALRAEDAPAPVPTPSVEPGELNRTIGEVIQQNKYAWRMPREKAAEEKETGLLQSFIDQVVKMMTDTLREIGRALDGGMHWLVERLRDLLDWLFNRKDRSASDPASWMTPQLVLLFAVLAVTAGILGVAVLRLIQARRKTGSATSAAVAIAPDLEDENTRADELPEDEWTRLGRELWSRGELRLALRAFYLASLSHLAARGMITVARSKSNREYERELHRRAHSVPELPRIFGENVSVFDRVWYGFHETNNEALEHFLANLERMKAAA